jgi:hypothetical protein
MLALIIVTFDYSSYFEAFLMEKYRCFMSQRVRSRQS